MDFLMIQISNDAVVAFIFLSYIILIMAERVGESVRSLHRFTGWLKNLITSESTEKAQTKPPEPREIIPGQPLSVSHAREVWAYALGERERREAALAQAVADQGTPSYIDMNVSTISLFPELSSAPESLQRATRQVVGQTFPPSRTP